MPTDDLQTDIDYGHHAFDEVNPMNMGEDLRSSNPEEALQANPEIPDSNDILVERYNPPPFFFCMTETSWVVINIASRAHNGIS